jgi:hypothetical protein
MEKENFAQENVEKNMDTIENEIKRQYYESQGFNTQDASREFYLKAIKERAKKKGYKISGFDKMSIKVLKAIYNKSNNLNK